MKIKSPCMHLHEQNSRNNMFRLQSNYKMYEACDLQQVKAQCYIMIIVRGSKELTLRKHIAHSTISNKLCIVIHKFTPQPNKQRITHQKNQQVRQLSIMLYLFLFTLANLPIVANSQDHKFKCDRYQVLLSLEATETF